MKIPFGMFLELLTGLVTVSSEPLFNWIGLQFALNIFLIELG